MAKKNSIVFYHDVDIKNVEPVNYIDVNYIAFDVDKAIPEPFIYKKGKEDISDIWVKDNKLTKAYKMQYRETHNEKTSASVYVPKFPLAFDIETTTIIDYAKDKKGNIKYDDTGSPVIERAEGYAYHWQILVNETIVHCKSWEECMDVFLLVCNKLRLSSFAEGIPNHIFKARCLIANMGFEFQFMHQHFIEHGYNWTKVFAISNRNPLIAETDSGLVFQDALKISNSSLEKLSKLYLLPSKKTHDLDYSLVRNTKTEMTEEELRYCSLDVRILGDFHRWIMQNYHANGLDYPLTSTGLLRDTLGKYFELTEFKTSEYTTKDGKKKTSKELSRFAKTIPDLFPATYDEYADTMMCGFRGGYTHANARNADKILENVNGGDFTSSYPYVMMFQKFPVTKFYTCRKDISVIEYLIKKGRAVMMKLRFHGLINITSHSLESINKTWEYKECGRNVKEFLNKTNAIIDNGRVLRADTLTVTLTDIDYESYKMFYEWDSVEVLEAKSATYGLLPDYVRLSVSTYYHAKNALKKADKRETTEYKLAKAMVNANYGLMCEKLHIDEIVFDPETNKWYNNIPQDKDELQQAYLDEIYGKNRNNKKYAKKPKTILSPYWGIWTTAHARNNLFQILMKIPETDSIYCDTDSIYFLNPEKNWAICEEYNKKVIQDNMVLINEWNEKWGFDIDKYNKMNPDEREKYVKETHGLVPKFFFDLGTFDKLNKLGNYTRFKTLGAKRYVKEWWEKGKLEVEQTIAGLPKTALCEYCKKNNKDPFDVFKNGMCIKNVKKAHAYNDKPHTRVITDYQGNSEEMTEYSSVGIFDVNFSMKMNSDYTRLIMAYVESIKRKDLRDYIRQGDKK